MYQKLIELARSYGDLAKRASEQGDKKAALIYLQVESSLKEALEPPLQNKIDTPPPEDDLRRFQTDNLRKVSNLVSKDAITGRTIIRDDNGEIKGMQG